MNEIDRIDCRNLSFSLDLSESRLNKAQLVFGEKNLKRIIVFSLYILGVRRTEISQTVKLPENTVRTMLKTISKKGIIALFNMRKKPLEITKSSDNKPSAKENIKISEQNDRCKISINETDIFILKKNKNQLKAMILTFAENGLISKTYAGKLLNVSSSHVGYLINDIAENDLSCLIDQRKGQKKDFVFTPEIKSELIVQFAINAATGKSTSSLVLAKDLEQRTSYELSQRSIRFHINNLGLKGKATQLWELVGLKKTL
ncbi:MAG: hypothetical protein JEZ09_12170 [Salinivirgaceae bacterium]|nr:hypothetical protein [Salinivirgaceae bacterium]